MTARNVYVINKLRWDRHARKNATSALRDHNRNGGRKYDFPENVSVCCVSECHAQPDENMAYAAFSTFCLRFSWTAE